MTEETFTLKEIEAAMDKIETGDKGYTSLPVHMLKEQVIAELTTPKFAEGQVVVFSNGKLRYARELQGGDFHISRPLSQTEVGDGWVSAEEKATADMAYSELRAEFDKLRDALEAATTGRPWVEGDYAACVREFERRIKSIKDALDAIPENLK